MHTSNHKSLLLPFFQDTKQKSNSYQNTKWRKHQLRNKWLLKWILQLLWFSLHLKQKQGQKGKLGLQIRNFQHGDQHYVYFLEIKSRWCFSTRLSPFQHPSFTADAVTPASQPPLLHPQGGSRLLHIPSTPESEGKTPLLWKTLSLKLEKIPRNLAWWTSPPSWRGYWTSWLVGWNSWDIGWHWWSICREVWWIWVSTCWWPGRIVFWLKAMIFKVWRWALNDNITGKETKKRQDCD